jgi:hypothetical protein
VLWPKIRCVGPTCQAGRPCNLAGWPSFLFEPPLGIGYLEHRLSWICRQNGFWKCANTWPADQGDVAGRPHLGSVELVLCATSFPCVILSMTMPYLDIMKICMDFGPYSAFPSSDVPEMVDQQKS